MLFKTIELNPTDSIAHNYKGMALSDLKRYEEAIELNPNNTFAINYRNIAIKKIKKQKLEFIKPKIDCHFDDKKNPFFKNKIASKEFHQEDVEYDEFTCKSTKIDWDPHYKVSKYLI